MTDPILGEIKMFAGNFAPRDWSFANGQSMSIAQNQPLFSLIGITYGGDGQTTFMLPDMRGRVPVHIDQGPGLPNWVLGEKRGVESVMLTESQMPNHGHTLDASLNGANSTAPEDGVLGALDSPEAFYKIPVMPIVELSAQAVNSTGSGLAHTNMMRFQALSFIICMNGIYPSQP